MGAGPLGEGVQWPDHLGCSSGRWVSPSCAASRAQSHACSLALSLERPTVARDTPPSPATSPFSQVRGLAGGCRVRPTGSCGLWAVLQVSEECA